MPYPFVPGEVLTSANLNNALDMRMFASGEGVGFIPGAVIFGHATNGGFQTDWSNLFYDDVNNRLGVGTNAPQARLHIGKTAATVRSYNSYIDPANGEWCYLGDWGFTPGVATFGSNKGGTGIARDVSFVRGGTQVMRLTADGLDGMAEGFAQAQWTMSGGGAIYWEGPGGRLSWTSRLLVIPVGAGSGAASQGYFGFNQPTTDIPAAQVWDGVARSATSAGVILNAWEALYAVCTPGAWSDQYSYRIVIYNASFSAPSNWMLIGAVNGDDFSIHLGTGAFLGVGGRITFGGFSNNYIWNNAGAPQSAAINILGGSFRNYYLYSDASNNEYAFIGEWFADKLSYGSGKAGTGAARDVQFLRGGVPHIYLDGNTKIAPGIRLQIGDLVGMTGVATTFFARYQDANLGDNASSYLYPFEYVYTAGNMIRLQTAPYRRFANSSWPGAGYRLQLAVDNSFLDGGLAYVELCAGIAGGGALHFGAGGSERLSITGNNGFVGINNTAPSVRLDVLVPLNSSDTIRLTNTAASGPGTSVGATIECVGVRGDGNGSFDGRFGVGFRRTDGSPIDNAYIGCVGTFGFGGQWGTDQTFQPAKFLYPASIRGMVEGAYTAADNMPTALSFRTGSVGEDIRAPNTNFGTERMRIRSDGRILIGVPGSISWLPQLYLNVYGGAATYNVFTDGSNYEVGYLGLWYSNVLYYGSSMGGAGAGRDVYIQRGGVDQIKLTANDVRFPAAGGLFVGPSTTQANFGADSSYSWIKGASSGGAIFVGNGSNFNYYDNNNHIWRNASSVQTASLDAGGNFKVSGISAAILESSGANNAYVRLRTTANPVNTRLWEIWNNAPSEFVIRAIDDNYTVGINAMVITRSGYNVGHVSFPSADGLWIGPNATQAAIGAGDANYTYIRPPVPGGTIFVGSGSNSNYYVNNIHIWQNQGAAQTASLDSGGNFSATGVVIGGFGLRAIDRSNSANHWELYVSSNVAALYSSSSGDMFKIDTSGNATLAGNVLRFGNATGLAEGAGGPLIYGDSNWTLLKTGINNQGWLFWDYNGAEIFRFDASSPYYLYIKAAKFLSTDGPSNGYNKIHDTSGGVAIFLGGGTDHTNHHHNTNHVFAGRDVDGSPDFMDINGSSTTIHQATYIYGGLTIATGNLWVGNGNVNCSSINSFNYYLGNQATSDAGTYGFTNGNGPSMVTWGSSSGGAGAMELRTSTGTHLSLFPNNGGVNHYKALQHYFFNMDASIEYARIDYLGTRNISGTWLTYSDLSIKRDIEPYERGLEAIAALNPISYRLKPGSPFYDPNRKEKLYGLISQDVRDIVPEMVSKYDHEELESLAPGHLVFVLVNAVKELKDRLEALEGKHGSVQ